MSLVVLEGLDGSGKGTQAKLLAQALVRQGVPLRPVTFPDYSSPSSSLVKMYLNGEFGSAPEDVNAYAASAFYAVDRFASFRKDWGEDYRQGKLILCDRYATSNMVYQMGKAPREEWDRYLAWVEDFEYQKLGIPRPDLVLYLDMPIEVSQKLLLERYHGDSGKKDIHESHLGFLRACRESARYAGQRLGWREIPCAKEGEPLPVEEIHRAVLAAVEPLLAPRWRTQFRVAVAGQARLDFTLADKGTGIRQLCAALDVPQSDVMAFGDNYNDLPMLEAVGHPILMEGALAELLSRFSNRCSRAEHILASLPF